MNKTSGIDEEAWELNTMDGKNPVHTGGFLTAYDQREFSPAEVIARESAQNAGDAGRDAPGITRIEFHQLKAVSSEKRRLIDLLQLEKLLSPRLDAFKKSPKNSNFVASVEEFLSTGKEMQALLIRDFNTSGLSGRWDRYEVTDHFARLVCALNLDDKSDADDETGGSFGLGKTAFAGNSKIHSVVYHSVFKPEEKDGAFQRLMVSGVYPRHSIDGVEYGGFAYFGKTINDGEDKIVRPLQNEEASSKWSELMSCFGSDCHRTENQHGTDILILCCGIDFDSLKKAIEDYYFPAILDKQLEVSFHHFSGEIKPPEPLSRDDLRPFIELFHKIQRKVEVDDSELVVSKLNRRRGKNTGWFAAAACDPDSQENPRKNSVALLRGTGMVINYSKVGSEAYEPAIGVFEADDDVKPYLKYSENQAHSQWSEHAQRLREIHPGVGPEIVKHLNSVIASRFLKFQQSLQPVVKSSRSRVGFLSRLMSKAFSGKPGDPQPEKNFDNPVSVHLRKKERSGAHCTWRLQLVENEHTPNEPFQLILEPRISLMGDSKLTSIKHMNIRVLDSKDNVIEEGTAPRIMTNFCKEKPLDFYIQYFNPGERNYVVRCHCKAKLSEVQNAV
ncbi:hypothetical protein HFP89_08070 [Wenzhouxiangella sp. XN79A]|uniref:hypothetical protein n=1 Tax=Wenzhouxiangella sp. XN79A TaxID=2724193 RepID=UPI00144AF5BC|nr:hypothetical protein [Wenzhouxiangella sp. XN79A]NKI35120.1 hypothetical protein [Wenzhouxiangella sp. XN79A]